MRNKIIAIMFAMLTFSNFTFPQNKISLLDSEKVKDYLELSQEQIKVIVPKIERIKATIEEDKKII
ncbi:MAG: hypothetical protein ACOYVE_05110 [Melioribacter sp.]|uniref:hypothetical protein n=1 Tax=Melioribacter sp. TaxID=2052167 RepID=UPI003BC6B7F1